MQSRLLNDLVAGLATVLRLTPSTLNLEFAPIRRATHSQAGDQTERLSASLPGSEASESAANRGCCSEDVITGVPSLWAAFESSLRVHILPNLSKVHTATCFTDIRTAANALMKQAASNNNDDKDTPACCSVIVKMNRYWSVALSSSVRSLR